MYADFVPNIDNQVAEKDGYKLYYDFHRARTFILMPNGQLTRNPNDISNNFSEWVNDEINSYVENIMKIEEVSEEELLKHLNKTRNK